jgi:hypothetical protein
MSTRVPRLVGSAWLFACFGSLSFALALRGTAQTYTIIELPPLPGDTYSGAYALNESGQAAGYSGDHAVIWIEGVPASLQNLPGASSSVAFGLNDSGHATGDVSPAAGNSGAFLWRNGTMLRILPPSGGPTFEYISEAYALNNSDTAVGIGGSTYLGRVATPTVNYYNVEDYALQTATLINGYINVSWLKNQLTKPDNPIGKGDYLYLGGVPGIYSGKKLLRQITDIHESLAFLARSRTRAVGAEPVTGRTSTGTSLGQFLQPINLQALYSFTGKDNEHSAQFNRPIQRQLVGFYTSLVSNASPSITP